MIVSLRGQNIFNPKIRMLGESKNNFFNKIKIMEAKVLSKLLNSIVVLPWFMEEKSIAGEFFDICFFFYI